LLSTLATTLLAIGYLFFATPKYEARALLEMAQVKSINNTERTNSTINIEPPELLIEWLKFPTNYSPEVITACGMSPTGNQAAILAKQIRVIVPAGLGSEADITLRRASAALARQCMESVVKMIDEHQGELLQANQSEARKTLARLQGQLHDTESFVYNSKSVSVSQTAYLARRDQLLSLIQQTAGLEEILSQDAKARLVAPIYVSPDPVSPIWWQTIVLGAFAGVFIGILSILFRDFYQQLRKRLANK
jgi:uncharacterized protein involved in exopolysaccharide biosynthesis